MKFPARDFNFQSLAERIDVSFLYVYGWRGEDPYHCHWYFKGRLVHDAYSIVLNLLWSEQNWIFLKPVHWTQWFRKMNELGTIQKDGHEEYTCRVWVSQN